MNKQTFKLAVKKVILMSGFVCALSLATYHTTQANSHTFASTKSAFHYVGTEENKIVFNVKFENPAESKFDLVITNENGDVVYKQSYSEKNFDKKIVLLKEGDAHLTFAIKSKDVNYKESFDISTTTKVVEDVVVTKL